jgi:hypothetical protein
VGSVELPSEPEEPDRVEHAGDPGADRAARKAREVPDPDERGRVYEAMRAHADADAAEQAEPGRRAEGEDRSAEPPESRTKAAGFPSSPERHAETGEAISRVREVEPRISADMRAIERENAYGGWLEGFEFRLKGDDRLKEKIVEGLATIGPDASPKEILEQIPDAVRYTFCLRPETYARGYYDIKERLESLGYEMYQSKNSWDAAEYKGINTRWMTQQGQRFEVQFHTPESFHAKQYVTHGAYERIRSPLTSDAEREELEAFQREVSSRIEVPDGVADIPDYKKEGF